MYADNLALIASSPEELQQMLDIVTQYVSHWQYSLNPNKSVVMVIGEFARMRGEPTPGRQGNGYLEATQCKKLMSNSTWAS